MIHAVRSTRTLLYTLQMSVADKLKCYVSIITVVASLLLLLCYFSFTGSIGMPQLENASIENLDDSEAGIHNPGCIQGN